MPTIRAAAEILDPIPGRSTDAAKFCEPVKAHFLLDFKCLIKVILWAAVRYVKGKACPADM
jgi:hypothetical protein